MQDEVSVVGPHPSRVGLIIGLVAALVGVLFAAESTNDFMQHLDRQVHAIHCSFIPGAGKGLGESGCKAVMMKRYSACSREALGGGMQVKLCALAAYAFRVSWASLLLCRGKPSRAEATCLLA